MGCDTGDVRWEGQGNTSPFQLFISVVRLLAQPAHCAETRISFSNLAADLFSRTPLPAPTACGGQSTSCSNVASPTQPSPSLERPRPSGHDRSLSPLLFFSGPVTSRHSPLSMCLHPTAAHAAVTLLATRHLSTPPCYPCLPPDNPACFGYPSLLLQPLCPPLCFLFLLDECGVEGPWVLAAVGRQQLLLLDVLPNINKHNRISYHLMPLFPLLELFGAQRRLWHEQLST